MIRKHKYGNEYLNYKHYLTQKYFVCAFAVCDAESDKIAIKIHGKIHKVYAFAVGDAEFNKTAIMTVPVAIMRYYSVSNMADVDWPFISHFDSEHV